MGLKITGNRIIPSGSVTQAKVSSAVFTGSANPVINTITTNGVLESYLAINATNSVRIVNSQTGYQGPTGGPGSQGNQGPNGIIGSSGFDGPSGYQGPQGYRGPQGNQGVGTGPGGFPGPLGSPGPASTAPGPQGPQGLLSPPGGQGFQGFTGPQGSTGGTQGGQGPQGFQGPLGPQGPQNGGYTGYQGYSAQSGEGSITNFDVGINDADYIIPTSEASAIYCDMGSDFQALPRFISLTKISTGSFITNDSFVLDTSTGDYYVEVACNYNDAGTDSAARIFTKLVDTTAMNTPILMMQAGPFTLLDDNSNVFTAKMQGVVTLQTTRIYTLRTWCVSNTGNKYWNSALVSVAPFNEFAT
jgi:hypothetical protein